MHTYNVRVYSEKDPVYSNNTTAACLGVMDLKLIREQELHQAARRPMTSGQLNY